MEMAVIAIIALIVLGPNKLPEAAKSLGKGFREMRDSFQGAVGSDDDEMAFGHHEDEDDEDKEDGHLDHHVDASEDLDPSDAVTQQDEKAGHHQKDADHQKDTDHQKDAESSVPSASSSSIERE